MWTIIHRKETQTFIQVQQGQERKITLLLQVTTAAVEQLIQDQEADNTTSIVREIKPMSQKDIKSLGLCIRPIKL